LKKNVSFITTASVKVGLGHLIRSLALASMLNDEYNIKFIIVTDSDQIVETVKAENYVINQITTSTGIIDFEQVRSSLKNTDIVILDFYKISIALQLAIKKQSLKLVCIDDFHEGCFYSDVVLNVSNGVGINDYNCEPYTKLLLGTDYVLLRPVFLQCAESPPPQHTQITSVFLNMGGSDLPNNTLKFLKAISTIPFIKEIHIVVGMLNIHKKEIINFINSLNSNIEVTLYSNIDSFEMKNVLLKCQVAVCPASGVSMEICSIGMAMVTGYTADNQKDLLKGLIDKNCVVNLNDLNTVSETVIINSIKTIQSNASTLREMVANQKELIDGHSGDRIKKVFQQL
jgi:UDP-2,4-diacetamido-2,4,6-trideoxy-beta-L-altropyranose hydrolase